MSWFSFRYLINVIYLLVLMVKSIGSCHNPVAWFLFLRMINFIYLYCDILFREVDRAYAITKFSKGHKCYIIQ